MKLQLHMNYFLQNFVKFIQILQFHEIFLTTFGDWLSSVLPLGVQCSWTGTTAFGGFWSRDFTLAVKSTWPQCRRKKSTSLCSAWYFFSTRILWTKLVFRSYIPAVSAAALRL